MPKNTYFRMSSSDLCRRFHLIDFLILQGPLGYPSGFFVLVTYRTVGLMTHA
jgi:hypothetical protein